MRDISLLDRILAETGGDNPFDDLSSRSVFDGMFTLKGSMEEFSPSLLIVELRAMDNRLENVDDSLLADILSLEETSARFLDYMKAVIESWRRRQIEAKLLTASNALSNSNDALLESSIKDLHEILGSQGRSDLLEICRLDLSSPPEIVEARFSLGGVEIATPGNIQVVTGPAKSGKSAIVEALIAALLSPESDKDTLSIKAHKPTERLLHFDTEQSKFHQWRLLEKSRRRAGLEKLPDSVESFHCAGRCPVELRYMLEAALKGEEEVFAVILDGVADFVADPNDPSESFDFVRRLHDLAIKHRCCIIGVLHLNPGSEFKTRGHLGSQLERKAETTIQIDAKDGISTVYTKNSRGSPLPKSSAVRFEWSDEYGMHMSIESADKQRLNEKIGELERLAQHCFKHSESMRHCDLHRLIMDREDVKDATANRRIKNMTDYSLIKKDLAGNYVLTINYQSTIKQVS